MTGKLSTGLLAAVALLAGSACEGGEGTGPAAQLTFSAVLTGANERPNPVTTTATGSSVVVVNETAQTISFSVTVSGLTDVTMAHIHAGDANTAGPIVVNLLPVPPAAGLFSGVLASGTLTVNDLVGGETFATLATKIRAGNAYVNVHTAVNQGGAIRGQLVAQ